MRDEPCIPASWVDPNATFAALSDYLDFMRHDEDVITTPKYFPVLLELCEGKTAGDLPKRARTPCDELPPGQDFRVPAAYPDTTRYCTAVLDKVHYDKLREDGFGGLVRRWELQLPVIPLRPQTDSPQAFGMTGIGALLGKSAGAATAAPPMAGTPGSDAGEYETDRPARQDDVTAGRYLLGIVDTGCPFAHASLAPAGGHGTRILKLWDQDKNPALTPLKAGGAPADFCVGWEVFRPTLEQWMRDHGDALGSVSEDSCYLDAGYGMVTQAFGHGAAVLSLLAGPVRLQDRYPTDLGGIDRPPTWKPANDAASSADIIFVQAPRDAVQDSSNAAMSASLLDGLRYIVNSRSDATQRIIVNISDGTSRHLHDGGSIIESAILDLVAEVSRDTGGACTLDVVIAAGNSRDDRRHARVRPASFSERDCVSGLHRVVVRIPPDGESPQFLNIRVPPDSPAPRFRITPPGGGPVVEIGAGEQSTWPPLLTPSESSCWLVLQPQRPGMATEGLIAWAPTGQLSTITRARGVIGDWTIECFRGADERDGPECDVQFWISLNQSNDGSVAQGRQARFVDADGRYDPKQYLRAAEIDQTPPSVIWRAGTLSGLATIPPGGDVWVVGSRMMRVIENRPWASLYSSNGPSADGDRVDVDGWRPTQFNRWSDGVRVSGTRSGIVLLATGTSFATAQWIRDLLELPPGQSPLKGDSPGPQH